MGIKNVKFYEESGCRGIAQVRICLCCITLKVCSVGAMDVALGSAATGVFTNSSWLWTHLYEVGHLHYY